MYLSLLKYLGPPILILLLLAGVYYKGKEVAEKSHIQEQMRLVVDRLQAEQKVVGQGQRIKVKINKVHKAPPSPAKDAAYSCILSSDPLEGKCKLN